MWNCLKKISASDAQILSDSFENNDRYACMHWKKCLNVADLHCIQKKTSPISDT